MFVIITYDVNSKRDSKIMKIVSAFMNLNPLDIRIGFVHSTTNRSQSLNLDLADIFKPIIVDRVIFSLINLKMINANDFFNRRKI